MLVHLNKIDYDEFSRLVLTTHFENVAYGLVHEFASHAIEQMIENSPAIRHFHWENDAYIFNGSTTDKPDVIIDAIDTALGNHDINDLVLGDTMDCVTKAIDSYRNESKPRNKKLKFQMAVGTFVCVVNLALDEHKIDSVGQLNMESLYHEFHALINWIYEYQNDDYVVDTESGIVYKSLDEY